MATRTPARKQRAPTPVASENPAADAAVAAATEQAHVPEQDTSQLSLEEIVTTLEGRSMDVRGAIDRLYLGTNDPPVGASSDQARAESMRDRLVDIVSELHVHLTRIEEFTGRLGAPL